MVRKICQEFRKLMDLFRHPSAVFETINIHKLKLKPGHPNFVGDLEYLVFHLVFFFVYIHHGFMVMPRSLSATRQVQEQTNQTRITLLQSARPADPWLLVWLPTRLKCLLYIL